MSNGKVIIVYLIVGLIKKFWCDSNVWLKTRFSSYVFKALVALQRIKMSQYFPKRYEAFSGDINVRVDLSNYATKADIKNILHVDTSSFAVKTSLAKLKTEEDKSDIDKLVPVTTDFSKFSNVVKNDVIKKTDYNAKITEIENKIPDISSLATKTALNTVENKIPNTSGLVKKTDYIAKITETEGKFLILVI